MHNARLIIDYVVPPPKSGCDDVIQRIIPRKCFAIEWREIECGKVSRGRRKDILIELSSALKGERMSCDASKVAL